ncbi:hypothetical protein ACFL04_01785 [Patescibacteria group bacterium]
MNKSLALIVTIVFVFGIILIIWFFMDRLDNNTNQLQVDDQQEDNKIVDDQLSSYIPPTTPADDRFGFLSGPGPEELQDIRNIGAGWARPHPGPFIWGDMQPDIESDTIVFTETDEIVKDAQEADIQLLITLWHYNKADQEYYLGDCRATGEEFVAEFGRLRCPPANTEKYKKWVEALVERYDGDGVNDMPDLITPIKHWEVMNEPDLNANSEITDGLQFWVGTPGQYAELLINTSKAIRSADNSAQILIAGAAGGNNEFLSFYRNVLTVAGALEAFDIANVHCISNDDYKSLNVEPYAALLSDFGINKPVWVTEAETFISDDQSVNAAQLKSSTQRAVSFGAEKIFYTGRNFLTSPGGGTKDDKKAPEDELKPLGPMATDDASKAIFQDIFNSI